MFRYIYGLIGCLLAVSAFAPSSALADEYCHFESVVEVMDDPSDHELEVVVQTGGSSYRKLVGVYNTDVRNLAHLETRRQLLIAALLSGKGVTLTFPEGAYNCNSSDLVTQVKRVKLLQ